MTRVIRVLAPNPGPYTLEGTNTWIVGRDPSVVIDPGPDDAGHILAVLEEAEPVSAILLSHHHPDHAPGAARLAEATRAPVFAFAPGPGERKLSDGDVVHEGEAAIRAVHTPGHTPDHLSFLLEPEGALFTGDAILGKGTSVVDPPEGDMTAYVASLERMSRLGATSIYPGHGPVVFDARERIDAYIRHRRQRERQVLGALGDGLHTPSEIVPPVYGEEIPADMYPVAARSVLAHLLKLEREGKAVRTGRAADNRFNPVQPKACSRCGRPARPGSRFCSRCGIAVLQESPERQD